MRKIRIIFDLENWLWKSEIVIFRSLDLERRLIWQKICFMKKCYFSLINLPFDEQFAEKILNLPNIYNRDLTIILVNYQYTYQVSVYWYLYLVFWFSNTDTDTSYFKNVLKYWYFSIVFLISISIFLFIFKELVTINTPILASSGL